MDLQTHNAFLNIGLDDTPLWMDSIEPDEQMLQEVREQFEDDGIEATEYEIYQFALNRAIENRLK